MSDSPLNSGDWITLVYEGKEFDVIVIDPNGLGESKHRKHKSHRI
jgi:23S rRNA G2069 N7-methylase RlmK/C1962 C5-methylase RlmI